MISQPIPPRPAYLCNMETETKERIVKIVIAAVLLAAAFAVQKLFPGLKTWQLLLVYLLPYLVAGWETLREGAEKLLEGEALLD